MPEANGNDLAFFEESGVGHQSPIVGRMLADRYNVISELGRGGMGVVYLAHDKIEDCKVAVKMLMGSAARSPDLRARFKREAETASKLRHPGICAVRDFGEFDGLLYLVMDYIVGTTLGDILETAHGANTQMDASFEPGDPAATLLLDRRRPLEPQGESPPVSRRARSRSVDGSSVVSVDHMVRLIENAARALHYAHECGLVHRDIKPGNIMVTPEGEPVLLDFGLARDLTVQGQTLTESGQIVGTPAYLAPEQVSGKRAQVDRRTDIYALGVSLYECLTLERPIRGDTRDRLFNNILVGEWVSPRKLNPDIPLNLTTVVEKAMDREPARRYATAEEFADDLKRVRAFEPIRARRPGVVARLRRWAWRRPAKAAVAASLSVIVLAGATLLVHQSISRMRAARERQARAEMLLGSGNYTEALEVLAQARDLGLSESVALETKIRIERAYEAAQQAERKNADLAAAASARNESSELQEQYAEELETISKLRLQVEEERRNAFGGPSSDAVRGAFAAKEQKLARREAEADRLLRQAYEALERAARREAPWGLPGAETRSAFANYHLQRWREAVAARDETRAGWLKSVVEGFDEERRHEAELLGRGTLEIATNPPDAKVFLFRNESAEDLRPGQAVPRLIPVPTKGIGRIREFSWADGFVPGDSCLVILAVEEESIAAAQGLRPSDLVISVAGHGAGDGVIVRGVNPEAGVDVTKVPLLSRIVALNGAILDGRYDWAVAPPASGEELDLIRLAGLGDEISCRRSGLVVASPRRLLDAPAPAALRVVALRAGVPVVVDVPEGKQLGVRTEPTAYPLILAPENTVKPGALLSMDPGSYLLFVRREGFEDQRFPIEMLRGGTRSVTVFLRTRDSTPEGFVHVPAGPFRFGGDRNAVKAAAEEVVELEEFFIARTELTNREWFEFVNDEPTLARIEKDGGTHLLPRDPTRVLAVKRPEGRGWTMPGGSPETPVLGISWNDVQEYLQWRNSKAEASREAWIYDLPTLKEWEKAARGVDGRSFPWGNRFDFSLTVSEHRKTLKLLDAPAAFEPRDESPYGVRDLAGSRQEWIKDQVPSADPDAPPSFYLKGGAWGVAIADVFRAAGRGYANGNFAGGLTGVRLVARPRK